jgi:hypothetical protein
MHSQMVDFIAQDMNQAVAFDTSRSELATVLSNSGDEDQPPAVDALVEQQLDSQQSG